MPHIDYTHIFEDSLNEIYVFSADTLCFLEVNRGARENLGYSMAELRGLTPLDLKRDYTPEQFQALIAPLREGTQEKIRFETTHRRKDGTFYPVEVHLHLSNTNGKQVFVAIILDITERKRGEEHALQLALEQERVRLLREFIGDASHDLRTPLTQAGTSLYLLSHHTDKAKHHEYIHRAQDALSRVSSMIDSMLQMSALDLQDNYEMEPLNVNKLLEAVVYANEAIARQNRLSLVLVPAMPDTPFVLADTEYLIRALENILMNAFKYTDPGGKVIVQAVVEGNTVQIRIRDTGIGIAPEHLPHIFKRFYRGQDARNTAGGSNGMGLSVSKKIIDKHQGTIDVETTVGKGTTFCVTLPRTQRKLHPHAQSGAVAG